MHIIGSIMKNLHLVLFTLIFISVILLTITQDKPNILVIWGDEIEQSNISAYTMGMMEYQTLYNDYIANVGIIFNEYYGERS